MAYIKVPVNLWADVWLILVLLLLLPLLGAAAASTLILSIFVNADDEIKAIADNKIAAVLTLPRMAVRLFLSILVFIMVIHPE